MIPSKFFVTPVEKKNIEQIKINARIYCARSKLISSEVLFFICIETDFYENVD